MRRFTSRRKSLPTGRTHKKEPPDGGSFSFLLLGLGGVLLAIYTFAYVSDGLFSFNSERKEEKKRRQKLRFWISLRGFTYSLSRWNKPRERCAVQISSKCCIVSASLFAAAFALKYRSNRFYRGRDQRQRRRRRDDPFVRTTNSNFRDRVAQTTDKHRA